MQNGSFKRALDPFPEFTRFGTPDNLGEHDAYLGEIADDLEKRVTRNGASSHKKEGDLTNEDIRFVAYALIAHRVRRGKLLDEDHLRMLAAGLDIKRLSTTGAHYLGISPVKGEKAAKYHRAAEVEAEHPEIRAEDLAKEVGVSPTTIRAWRRFPQFARRVEYCRALKG